MATYDLKYPGAAIDAILDTAYHLQQAGYIFRGSASDYSGTPTEREWVIAPAGFSGLGLSSAVPQGSIGICLYNGTSWTGKIINVLTLDSAPTRNSQNGVTSGGVAATLDEIAGGIMATFASLLFDDETAAADLSTKLSYAVKFSVSDVYQTVTHLNILAATTSKAGLLSAADKVKIDSFLTNLRSLTFADTTASADQATQITETLKATIGGVQEVIDSITLLAATSSKAGLLSAADKAYIDALPATLTSLSNSISGALALMQSLVGYYVCDTAAGTAAKTVAATGYSLTNGGCIRIKMTNANTADNVTLNINSTGAKALYYDGAQASSTNTWEAGEVLEVYYDGTQYQCASGGGGKFATGQKVADVGITNELDNSHNLIESAAVNAVLNESMIFSEWVIGSLNANHTYLNMTGRIEACAVINGRALNYTVASGYAMSIHEYSGEFYTIPTIIGNTWIKQTSSWIEGSGTFTPDSQTKTIVVILSKTPTGSQLNIQPSDAVNLTIDYTAPFTLDDMREMLAEHDADIEAMQGELYSEKAEILTWYQGTLVSNVYAGTGGNTAQRIICTVPAPTVMDVTVATGYYCSIHEYSDFFQNPTQITSATSWLGNTHGWFDGTLKVTPLAATKTMVLIMSKGSNKDQNVTPTDGSNISVESLVSIKRQTDINTESIEKINDTLNGINTGGGVYIPSWYQGTLNDNHSYVSSGGNAPQRIICTVPVTDMLNVTVASGYWASVHEYSEVYANVTEITGGSAWLGNTHPWFDGSMDITPLAATKTFVIVMSKGNKNVNISPSEGSNTTITTGSIRVEGLIEKVENLAYDDSDSYYWGADMIKRKCRTTYLGMLTYLQAFCKYDGKYYSTDGSSIAEQDEDFNVLRNVTCSVGHGNSLQLVSNGKAWASGWDDQKMYRVDLATLAVDQTITLPTTGYTTCAVDEDNGWMYIFQRQTNPSTEAQYNFIKYDYVNEQIISTRKIETFAALQAVDYWQGKILMLNGFGTQAAPSGMRIYNTSGDVLVTYDLQVFRAKEPEGIIFTRDKGELLVSDVDKKLYIVS